MLSPFPHNSRRLQRRRSLRQWAAWALSGRLPRRISLGSMLAVAVAALAGRPMTIPVPMARLCFILVGIYWERWSPGNAEGIAAAAECRASGDSGHLHDDRYRLLFAPGARLGSSIGIARRGPGSMAQVMALSAEFNADVRGIAIVHVMRVLLIVLGLPAGLALFGSTVEPVVSTRGASESSLLELVTLVTVSTIVALAMLRVRFPGGLLFGAMAGSAFLHGMDLVRVSLPWWAGGAAVLTLGAVAGARFANTSPRMLLSYLGAAFGSFAVAVAVAAAFALIVWPSFHFGLPTSLSLSHRARGHDDGARPCSTPRPCLRRGASFSPIPGRELFSGYRGPAPRAQTARTAAPELDTAGTGDI